MISPTLGDLDNKVVMHEIFFSTPVHTRHSENHLRTFKKLLKAGQPVGTDDMVMTALLNGFAEGLYYRIILNAKGESM